MSWTTHGHHIPGTMGDPSFRPNPDEIVFCGGPPQCTQCFKEVKASQNKDSGFAEPIKEGLPDPQLEELLAADEEEAIAEVKDALFGDDELGELIKRESMNRVLKRQDNTSIGPDQLMDRFGYHKPTDVTAPMHQAVRQIFYDGAMVLDKILPNGRAKFQAIMELELALMWANKAIAEMAPVVEE